MTPVRVEVSSGEGRAEGERVGFFGGGVFLGCRVGGQEEERRLNPVHKLPGYII